MNPTALVRWLQTAALLAASLLLAYPVAVHGRNVPYTPGVLGLSAGFFLGTASYVLAFFGHPVPASVATLLAALAVLVGLWSFARPFLRDGSADVWEPPGSANGGFDRDR